MCIIIQGKPNDITKKILKNAYQNNENGFGLMYLKNKKVISERIYPKGFKSIKKLFNKHKNETDNIALHFRLCTNGEKTRYNSHPFNVFNKEFKYQMSLMHNSPTLPCAFIDKKYSDTYYFVKQFLNPVLTKNINLIKRKDFKETLEKIINVESESKILLLDNFQNKFTFLGTWYDYNKLKVSNNYGLRETISYSDYWDNYNSGYGVQYKKNIAEILKDKQQNDNEKTLLPPEPTEKNSSFSSYKDDKIYNIEREELQSQYEEMIEILENGDTQQIMEELGKKPVLYAKLLKAYFHDNNQLTTNNDLEDLINDKTIKTYG